MIDDDLLDEYGVENAADLEVFILRISNYLINEQSHPLTCKCPAFNRNSIGWFGKFSEINRNLSIFQLKCTNLKGMPFALNYSCGVILKISLSSYFPS